MSCRWIMSLNDQILLMSNSFRVRTPGEAETKLTRSYLVSVVKLSMFAKRTMGMTSFFGCWAG